MAARIDPMRRRPAFFVSVTLAALVGCAGVLGLEDRHLESGDLGSEAGEDVVSNEAIAPLDSSTITDAASDVLPDSPCGSSVSVYWFATDVGGRGYVIDRNDAPMNKTTKRAFGLLDPRFPLKSSALFYALRNDGGDYLVSPKDAESDYIEFEQLANIGDDEESGPPPPPPARPIVRYMNDAGTAHRFGADGDNEDGWQTDNHVWWVCP